MKFLIITLVSIFCGITAIVVLIKLIKKNRSKRVNVPLTPNQLVDNPYHKFY